MIIDFVFIIVDVPPPVNLKPISVQGSQQIILQWNASEAANLYIITVSPPSGLVAGPSGSSFEIVTHNVTVEIPVLYNHHGYNISVVASNCAGNSTPAEITMLPMVSCKCNKC